MPSLLDGELEVSQTSWIVALLRKPAGANPEHAFIMVEGSRESGRTLLRRYDLVIREDNGRQYEIIVKEVDKADALARGMLTHDFLKNEDVYGKCWQISYDKAEELHQLVEESRAHPERAYNILGEIASSPKMLPDSEKQTIDNRCAPVSGLIAHGLFAPSGHNCFTWARAMLYQLDSPSIKKSLPIKSEELMVSITSRLLQEDSATSLASVQCTSKPTCRLM